MSSDLNVDTKLTVVYTPTISFDAEEEEYKKEKEEIVQCSSGVLSQELQASDQARQQEVLDREKPKELFLDMKNGDLYWEAFVLAGRGQFEEAKNIAEAIKLGEGLESGCPWKKVHPGSIDHFFDRYFISLHSFKPQKLNSYNLLESVGIQEHNRSLNNVSPNALKLEMAKKKELLASLKEYDLESLTLEEQISYKICLWQLEHEVDGEKFLFHNFLVRQLYGVLGEFSETFQKFHKLETVQDFENYNKRLAEIPNHIDQILSLQEEQTRLGIIPPRNVIEKVIPILEEFAKQYAKENTLYTHLMSQFIKTRLNVKHQVQWGEHIITGLVTRAFAKLLKYNKALLEQSKMNNGVWSLPNGDEYYRYCLKEHTTTQLSPDEIYEIGLEEVDSIKKEMGELLKEIGAYHEKRPVGESIMSLAAKPNSTFPDSDEGRKECISELERLLERSRKELGCLFDLKPPTPVVIQPVPKHKEEGSPGAYYHEPSLDGTRAGVFFVNLRDMKELWKGELPTLVVHEAEPGHHFHFALQVDSELPLFRRVANYNAYVEGWALYVERLAYEQGFFKTPQEKLGHLQDKMLRAARLVVDTGLHFKKWTRKQAIKYMKEATGYTQKTVETEIDRYLAWPGQACSYTIGMIKILELRKKAMQALGNKFDIKAFHSAILKVGAVPLPVLEEVIDRYILESGAVKI